ncbi:Beta-glucoside bgl operon antiterminator, BglG family [Cronobacter condimenti 1330]|uniref:Beta-glucoside bgl operon antiterminator, BglG family n=1 Tax=Cronobacter condimenti 1330 TaxID=1073999 RepID=K8A3N9_9ENTR|nr:Beta-glucoside bgl operon antiterminator, BglG family [Cronobacter condimenti 1330]
MIIKQILNNNVVSAVDERGQEVIITGRGLGFNASVGETVETDKVEKTFRLHDDTISARFKVLLDEVPVEIVQLTDDIVALARQTPGMKLSEGIYVTLADHLFYAIERSQKGLEIANPLQWEVRHFYQANMPLGDRHSR